MVSAEAATDGTLSGALASVTGSVRELQSELASELSGQEIRGFDAPDTLTQAYADAQATQQALVDGGLPERKRKERDDAEAIKLWAKPPGTSLIDPDVAPFLAYNEEYFRDITAADVANLVPAGPTEPADDPDYRVPALGRYYALEWEDEDAREAARARRCRSRRRCRTSATCAGTGFPTTTIRFCTARGATSPGTRSATALGPCPRATGSAASARAE